MDSRSSAYRYSNPFPEGSDRRNASDGLLGTDPTALLFADAGFRDRPMGEQQTPKEGNSQQALAAYLEPLIGNGAGEVSIKLLARFGTIARAVDASPEALADALPSHRQAASKINAARRLIDFAVNEQLVGRQVDPADPRLHAYLRAKLQNPVEERMQAVFMDQSDMFIASEKVANGSSGELRMRIRHVVHRALDLGASRLLIAHNHPSGSCTPSEADWASTEKFVGIASAIDIEIVDHLIISNQGIFSMKQGEAL